MCLKPERKYMGNAGGGGVDGKWSIPRSLFLMGVRLRCYYFTLLTVQNKI